MTTPDQHRLAQARTRPRIVELWRALAPLRSIVRLMSTGAHPDDETSGMLAALGWRDGVNLSYACSTRGEGGQNDIGTESGPALGALRTREMERACDLLDMRLYWHSTAPDDTITDFRFSKSGDETLGIWGHDRLMARFVEIVRTERPDILVPTFLDVPGQHGHHRAMTRAAIDVMSAAADLAFPSDLPPWRPAKLYLPAWSGAGQAYDDDLPPPEATLVVPAGRDPVTGWSYERIGQMSRAAHRTQGMGRWVGAGTGRDWPLHLAIGGTAEPEPSIKAGLPADLDDLAALAPDIAADLRMAHAHVHETLESFPDFQSMAVAAMAAFEDLCRAHEACPRALMPRIGHHLHAKKMQLARVLRLAHGIDASIRTADTWLRPGGGTTVAIETDAPEGVVSLDLPNGWSLHGDRLGVAADAECTDPYRPAFDPADPPAPRLLVHIGAAECPVAFERPPVVLPARSVTATPQRAFVNLNTGDRWLDLRFSEVFPPGAPVLLDLPEGWNFTDNRLHLPSGVEPGLHEIPVLVDGAPAHSVTRIDKAHVDPTASSVPARLLLRTDRVALPDARIGYVGSGHDQVDHWLESMGLSVDRVEAIEDFDLDTIDTLVIGIFALRFRPGLAGWMPRIHDWVRGGGTLVTLYHRPWDNWTPESTPPARLEIGQPSLRWRVTDARARVTQLVAHPVLTTPNVIQPEDWDGWVKERGLYFARDWDPVYTALLSMSDPGEAPLTGALLAADIGRGRHVHCSLNLHHQMANLVPGAFRLMANIVTPR